VLTGRLPDRRDHLPYHRMSGRVRRALWLRLWLRVAPYHYDLDQHDCEGERDRD
jgi:hypothetical protein